MPLKVLYEDNHLLAVAKPVGLPTQGALADRESLVKQAKEYLRQKYRKPGNVYLGVVSRLDSPVSGVVVFARTSKAAARLNEQFRNRQVEKIYWALVEGRVEPAEAECVDWLAKDDRQQRMEVVRKPTGSQNKAIRKADRRSSGSAAEIQTVEGVGQVEPAGDFAGNGTKTSDSSTIGCAASSGRRRYKIWFAAEVCRRHCPALSPAGDRTSGKKNAVGIDRTAAEDVERICQLNPLSSITFTQAWTVRREIFVPAC